MTRYNDHYSGETIIDICQQDGYREGVDRVLEYIKSIHAYPKLVAELTWAIEEGII